jgi:MFS family permease
MSENIQNISPLKLAMRAFHYRNYRLYFMGQGISLIGNWMQRLAMSWLVYSITGSAFYLGAIDFLSQLPILVLSPFGGVLADRLDRRKVLIVLQILAMVQAGTIAVLTLLQAVQIWHLVALGIFLGFINAFDAPTRQSFTVKIVDKKEDLGNAIALNSAMFNGARLIGPSIAGVLIAAVGEGICFLLNSVSYLAVIASLLLIKIAPDDTGGNKKNAAVFGHLKEGLKYSWNLFPVRIFLTMCAFISLTTVSYVILMPVFAKNVLMGGPRTLGFLMGSTGVGALCGALFLASRKNVRGLLKIIPKAMILFGTGLIGMSCARQVWLAMIFLMFSGFGMMVMFASSNTLLQTIIDDDKRGRVMSLYSMSFMGMMPFGSLISGSVASRIGAPATVAICGVCCFIGVVYYYTFLPRVRDIVREIYLKMGIITEEEFQKTASLK